MDYAEMIAVLSQVEYKTWKFNLFMDGPRPLLQLEFLDVDGKLWKSRKWFLSSHMTKGELVQTCLKAVLTAEEHEAREGFLFRGVAVFGPHIDFDRLYEAAIFTNLRKNVEQKNESPRSL